MQRNINYGYRPTHDHDMDDDMDVQDPPIQGYYCTCKSGARILGTCAHIANVLWYIGYARHEQHSVPFIESPPCYLRCSE